MWYSIYEKYTWYFHRRIRKKIGCKRQKKGKEVKPQQARVTSVIENKTID